LAQIAFCDTPRSGLLVLAGITLVSPFSGLGCLLGAMFGTAVGRFLPGYSTADWGWGLAGFNPAIVGLFWGGFLASGEHPLVLLVPLLAATMVLDVVFRRFMARFALPSLSLAALTTLYAVSLIAAPNGGWFWTDAPTMPIVPFGIVGAVCVVTAMALKSPIAATWAALLSAITFLAAWLTGHPPARLMGLWAISIPLASFGIHAVFMRNSLAGCITGTLAAVLSSLLWLGWHVSPVENWVPPLLLPYILGVWAAFLLMRRLQAAALAQPLFWRVVGLMLAARSSRKGVIALVHGGRAGDGVVSSFTRGTWLDPTMPRSLFSPEELRNAPRCRRAFWDACDRLRREAATLAPEPWLQHLGWLERRGWLSAVIVQDVADLAHKAGIADVTSLHGTTERTLCLGCGAVSGWPPQSIWRYCDLRCTSCQGPLVPSITLFGSAVDGVTADRLRQLLRDCGGVLVVGHVPVEPATADFLDAARAAGATVVFVAEEPGAHPKRTQDCVVYTPVDRFLRYLNAVLAVWQGIAGRIGRVFALGPAVNANPPVVKPGNEAR
jgi:NAD-dependent SIR2 family protein deacetylase/urea transporter